MSKYGFSDEWLNELRSRNEIGSIVGKYVNLKRRGRNLWACCPFHFEKTPSFAVNDYEQFYHCFGCGASGDVIRFVSKIESIDFYDACKMLAGYANMELPQYENNENILKQKKLKEKYLRLLKDAGRHYYTNLRLPEAKVAQDYLIKRRLDAQTVKDFGIGYSLDWDEIVTYLKSLGYSWEDMAGAGVCDKRTNNIFDCYAKRLIFPIINSYGDVIGFSGRILENSEYAKYKNTAQTILFDKSKCVYNINHIREQKKAGELKDIIIVEGQMDVVSLYKNGIKNAVACMGTALTPYHAKEIKKFSDKVVVCFDGDGAGKKATLRSLEILVKSGLNVFVMSLPNGMDPDEYILKNSREAFLAEVNRARYWVEFLIYDFAEMYNLKKPEEKTKFVKDSLNVIKSLDSKSEQDIYLDLVKNLSNISISVLRSDMEKNADIEVSESPEKENKASLPNRENANIKAVKFVMAALLHKKEYAKLDDRIKDNLLNPDYAMVYDYIKGEMEAGRKPIVSTLFDMFDVDNTVEIYDIINFDFATSEDNEGYYKDCLRHLVRTGLEIKQKEIMSKIALEKDIDARRELSKELQRIILELKGND